MPSIDSVLKKANEAALKKIGAVGFYRSVTGENSPNEFFTVSSSTTWHGDDVVVSLTDFHIQLLDRPWQRGDEVVIADKGVYEVHNIVNLDAGMLTLLATKK